MEKIQTDVSEQALVTAIRANMCSFYRHLARSFPGGSLENDKFIRWRSPIPLSWFNGVLSSQPPAEVDRDFIEESIRYFRDEHVAAFTWWLEPHLQCPDWEPVLSSHGFRFSNDTPGMAIDLQALAPAPQTVDGLAVREVADEASLRTWAHVFSIGYGVPPNWESSILEFSSRLGLDFPIRNYLAEWNGEPVGTASLFIGGGVAGIYNVSTLPAARGKGIGTAATFRALQTALERGYRIGVLQSSEMGYNVYQKLGFRHLCQIEYFHLALT
jgi:GNAT superfamily N-acetyltransferase